MAINDETKAVKAQKLANYLQLMAEVLQHIGNEQLITKPEQLVYLSNIENIHTELIDSIKGGNNGK